MAVTVWGEKRLKNVAERYFKKLFKYDLQTYYHSLRVAEISNFIGKTLGITEIELKELYYAALLHDIGKMAIPINILKKQEPLSEKEWEIIRQHPQKAIEILHFKDLKRIEKIIPAIVKGYPYKGVILSNDLEEDFAKSVELFLSDTENFINKYPNRAFLLIDWLFKPEV